MSETVEEVKKKSAKESAAKGKSTVVVDSVSVIFDAERGKVHAVDNVSLSIHEGEFVCLLGPSGCGKSTLLNVIGGFLQATSGAVKIDGEEVRGPDPRRVFVFQERGVLPWLTVEGTSASGCSRWNAKNARSASSATSSSSG